MASPDDTPLRLDERIPDLGFADADAALDCFLGWVLERGITPYDHQEETFLELFAGSHVVLDTPTGSGKSLCALAQHFKTFSELGRTFYTAPIKALVSEKFFELCRVFGAEHVGMMTGDGAINRDAPIVCCTAEILSNLALREGADARVDSVVMDEFHYYADRDRGMAWQIPLLTLPNTQFLLMSATLGDTSAIRDDLERRTGRPVAHVDRAQRPIPLEYRYSMDPVHEAIDHIVRSSQAPLYIVHFSQREASEQAQALMSVNYCDSTEKDAIAAAVRGFRFDSPFGKHVERYIRHGVGLHHAGMLPRYRLLVEKLAQQGLLKIICGTDTLGVGINVPIRSVLFTKLCKYDGRKVDILTRRDFQQIAGRAGRAGFDTRGYVVVQAPAHVIDNARLAAKHTDPKKLRKVRKSQPPTHGFKHWDEDTFRQLVDQPPETLQPTFRADLGQLLAVMQHAQEQGGDALPGLARLHALVDESHLPDERRAWVHEQLDAHYDALLRAQVVHLHPGPTATLDPDLQHDFSLHHSLSLFLVAALSSLDRASPTYALDVVTMVEAILDHPMAILNAQTAREKGRKVAALKAEGIPYEDRLEALEGIRWPEPMKDELWAMFDAYVEHHPWLDRDALKPKAVARELAEGYRGFADYIGELGAHRSEGQLLRYLTDVYKALLQNVPEAMRTAELTDLLAWLRALLGRVDSSLVTEWERLLAGSDAPATAGPPPPLDISADPKAFAARIRAELHGIVAALARSDWEEAHACMRGNGFLPADIEAAVQPFLDEAGDIAFDH
ncbi:MAG: DUF3516 domain-containing protein, partial [Alphaproteobacteria bacterium]|nr:DUF3516 domain-containing protein [Alphaproteobacteria bacterium]